MDSKEFKEFRGKLQKTQKQMAILLGTSLKAIHSYEQGWRSVPPYIEKQMIFLATRSNHPVKSLKACWTMMNCPIARKRQCPAWEFKAGKLCWFINGTICGGQVQKNRQEKMEICRSCKVLNSQL